MTLVFVILHVQTSLASWWSRLEWSGRPTVVSGAGLLNLDDRLWKVRLLLLAGLRLSGLSSLRA